MNNLPEPLTEKISIYVPTTLNGNVAAPKAQVNRNRQKVKMILSNNFGGFSETVINGGWYSNATAETIQERIYKIEAYTTPSTLKLWLSSTIELCKEIKADQQQEAISLEINNKLYFI